MAQKGSKTCNRSSKINQMKELLNYIISSIVKEGKFEIEENIEENFSNFVVKVPQESMGLLIGKEGRVIKSIRNLLKVKATLEKRGVNISLQEI